MKSQLCIEQEVAGTDTEEYRLLCSVTADIQNRLEKVYEQELGEPLTGSGLEGRAFAVLEELVAWAQDRDYPDTTNAENAVTFLQAFVEALKRYRL